MKLWQWIKSILFFWRKKKVVPLVSRYKTTLRPTEREKTEEFHGPIRRIAEGLPLTKPFPIKGSRVIFRPPEPLTAEYLGLPAPGSKGSLDTRAGSGKQTAVDTRKGLFYLVRFDLDGKTRTIKAEDLDMDALQPGQSKVAHKVRSQRGKKVNGAA